MTPCQTCTAPSYAQGIRMLDQPVWPLCNLMSLLYLTAEHARFETLLEELPEDLETQGIEYKKPAEILEPYVPALKNMEYLKRENGTATDLPVIVSPEGETLDMFDGLMALTHQMVLEKELERINSLLCGPCGCTLCCTGPAPDARQKYFEIPLLEQELQFFDLPKIDTDASRSCGPEEDPVLCLEGRPFFEHPSALYHWSTGWSMILPKGHSCPHLKDTGTCNIYPDRPAVCRKPQIFPVVLEQPNHTASDAPMTRRDTLLAVWDCPYVRDLKEKILEYAGLNGLKVIFKENKA